MFFSVKFDKNIKLVADAIINDASKYVLVCKLNSRDLKIDAYLREEYNAGLKAICAYLIKNCNYAIADDSTMIVSFRTQELNKLASLVTYGSGKTIGSNILRKAFSINSKGE